MDAKQLKVEAARAALAHVTDGMRLGIGSGTTAEAFVRLLADKVANGMTIIGVPTSERTASLCRELGVPLSTLDETPELDLTVDGADEVDADLTLIKGGGGALLREKIVAAASGRMIVIADATKMVDTLGRFPLPIEVNRFGLRATEIAIGAAALDLNLSGAVTLRMTDGQAFVTDGGHFILDASFGRIPDTRALSNALHAIPGVVEHGLFIGLASAAIIAGGDGIQVVHAARKPGSSTDHDVA
ncbi:ribose-5-phosphate isomerase RpiA [Mesorhizobium sp. ES1-1]|uniref:ribose-5-phosphate isomerase RpiA n=1 Tax=Mesorhizobium sp. ES1-1 TaxID=2876629 RepID=UPI001CC9B1B9|nr:ribose-5-phosphate isomerase RpiA [Mesorhizobium sp. ES1-1]MBZ9677646.1 ribose-5-phosphate isomerase RpiA [Mesorhizobium sp. ES1-1]